jgi:serine protease Do
MDDDRKPGDSGLKSEEEEQNQEQDQEQYSFIKETVKDRPLRVRRVLQVLLTAAGAAVIFGLISGAIMKGMISSGSDGQITIPTDESSVTVTPTPSPTATPTAAATPTPTVTAPTPTPTPVPTETPTPEEEEAQQISDYKELYAAIEKIAGEPVKSVVTVTGITSTEDLFNTVNESSQNASGLIVADNGTNLLILTDGEVSDGVTKILVTFADGAVVEGSFQKIDPATGLSIVTVPDASVSADTASATAVANLGNSYTVSQGQPVIAIGRPMGYSDSIVYGQISSVSNSITVTDGQYTILTTNIQGSTDGSGVLVDLDGAIVGIIMQEYAPESSGTITAIPISPLKNLIEKLSNNEPLCYIGITGEDVSEQISAQTGVPTGVYITSVDTDSPALAAGIMNADVLTEFDGQTVDSMKTYREILLTKKPGDNVAIKVMRSGAGGYVEFHFTVTIGQK